MMWPLIASGYLLVGGSVAWGCLGGKRSHGAMFGADDLSPAFAIVCGTMLVWPVLIAMAVDQGEPR